MEITFENKDLEKLIQSGTNKKYKKYSKDDKFMQALGRIYKNMCAAPDTKALGQFSYLHYEKLKNVDLFLCASYERKSREDTLSRKGERNSSNNN